MSQYGDNVLLAKHSTKISGPRRSGRLGFKLRQDLITVHLSLDRHRKFLQITGASVTSVVETLCHF